MKYRCKHCGRVFSRKSTKKWIKEYCGTTGKNVHIQRVKKD